MRLSYAHTQGLLKNFTGIDDPYEAPEKPEILIDTCASPSKHCSCVAALPLLPLRCVVVCCAFGLQSVRLLVLVQRCCACCCMHGRSSWRLRSPVLRRPCASHSVLSLACAAKTDVHAAVDQIIKFLEIAGYVKVGRE